MPETKEIDKPTAKEAEAQRADFARAYSAILDNEVPEGWASSDPEIVTREILERIMNAETFDDAFVPQEVASWQDMLDTPVRVIDFKFNKSALENQAIYAVVELALVDGGEVKTVTCGGRNVMMQLVKAKEKGWLGKPVAMTAKKTGDNNTVLWLTAVGNPLDDD
jgi:hypothetical protein